VPLLGQAVLAIWNDVADGADDAFNRWHIGEHLAERVGIPGFLRGRRYDVIDGERRYFTLYETERPDVLNGPDYLARLNNPTPATQRSIPLFRNNKRTACRVTRTLGAGIGGVIGTLDLGPAPGRAADLRAWLTDTALAAVVAADGIVAAHLCEADLGVTRVQAAEKALLDRPDDVARWVVLIEGTGDAAVRGACGTVLTPAAVAAAGAEPGLALATYRLVFALSRDG
jgi:hypothetical protein